MKKKRSIQKLSFHKEKISTLNNITAGAKTTTVLADGVKIVTLIVSEAVNCYSDTSCGETCNWMICAADYTEDC